jgi:NTE family protein
MAGKDQGMAAGIDRSSLGQIVLVLQGGGALGAYQAGVYQALHEAGLEPDWVIGTSIGAINAAIIAGNAPEDRVERLRAFWRRIEHKGTLAFADALPVWGGLLSNSLTVVEGLPGFFKPNPIASWGSGLDPETVGYYSVEPLAETLGQLIDIAALNSGGMRLTVGVSPVCAAEMRYFDSRDESIDLRHILASGALPPAFPPVRIDGELFWDGGLLSNTPVEAVFDDVDRRSGLVFSVQMWHPTGPEPDSMPRVLARQKDLQYASRSMAHVERQRQIHKLRHIISELAARLPPEELAKPEVAEMAGFGCQTRMHIVRLLAPPLPGEDASKDIDFSHAGITARWEAGYRDTKAVLEQRPWEAPFDPMEGVILHEAETGQMRV